MTKKFIGILSAIACAASACVGSMSASAEILSSPKTAGDLTYVIVDADEDGSNDFIRITGCSSSAVSLFIPKTLEDLPVQEVKANAFASTNALTSIDVSAQNDYFESDEDGVLYNETKDTLLCYPAARQIDATYKIGGNITTINDYAFANCTGLKEVDIPTSVTSIGDYAFTNCKALAKADIPASVKRVGTNAFFGTALLNAQSGPLYYASSWLVYSDTDLTAVINNEDNTHIQKGTTGIAGGSFTNHTKLSKVELPDSVLYINDYAFYNCDGLTSATLPTSVKEIGNFAFAGCDGFSDFKLPSNVASIGKGAFSGCTKLAAINIPTSLSEISESTFEGCSALEVADIPSNVKSIDKLAYFNCAKLGTVIINNKNCEIVDNAQTFSNSGKTYTGIIRGNEGSTAESYAKKYNRKFETLSGGNPNEEPITTLKGDANGDGKVNVRDAAAIASGLAKGTIEQLKGYANADFNGDGKVNVRDAAAIAKSLASK